MLRLITFGGLRLETDGRAIGGAALQKRRLAVLAVLAVGADRGATRDKLLGLFWADTDEARGRSALSQALYALRKATGEDSLVAGADTLTLDPSAITSDVAELEQALARGDRERVAALYAGPFLDGVYLSGAPEFERWVDRQRQRYAETAGRAVEALAVDAVSRGDHANAARWWRRFTELDPLKTRGALGLMSALAEAGDRAAALRHADAYSRLLREEVDAEPSLAVRRLADQYRGEAEARLFDARFAIERELGRGGMAVVFLARDRKHDRLVALKMLHPELGAAVGRARLEREIVVTARLQHPHILPLHDSGEADGTLYYVMPYVDGESLRARLQRDERIGLDDALRIAREVADALDYAHRHGVVHRDIKPENVLLADGHAVVADFGIARVISAAVGETVTQAGMVVGTPAYMSPEQIAGDADVGAASDIFSLGCVLFEMIAGRPPWVAASQQALLAQRFVGNAPALWTIDPGVPRGIDELVQQMLAPDPAARPASAGEVASRLQGTVASAPSRLPAPGETLVGRDREIAAACALLERNDVGLVTFTGAGGSGKTRLALRVAAGLEARFGRVYFVDLSTARDTAAILPAIAETIGAHAAGDADILHAVARVLATQRTLLVLDNFEQVVAGAPLLNRLGASAPSLTMLVTSRVRLGIRGEHEFFVAPLVVPADLGTAEITTLRDNAAVQLFAQRATEANPAVPLDDAAWRAIARICVRVDGLPLAIELAAARCRLMSPAAILARLEKGFELLTGGRRDAPERQQTLRQTVDWSRQLLTTPQQRLFARLAVFAGGCTLDAAEYVCGADQSGDVIGGVDALLDASLLMRDTSSGAAEPRLRMLEPVREFAGELLRQTADMESLAERHCDYYLRLAESWGPKLTGESQGEAVAALAAEHANLRAALGWTIRQSRVTEALRLGATLWRFWLIRAHLAEGRQWLNRVLSLSAASPERALRAVVLTGAGHLAQNHAAVDEAVHLFEQALEIRRSLGDERGVAQGLADLGWMAWRRCDYPTARALSAESLALAQKLDDRHVAARALSNIAWTTFFQGDLDAARHAFARSAQLREELSDRRGCAFARTVLAWTLCRGGDLAGARTMLDTALEVYSSVGDERLHMFALNVLAEVHLREGDAARAAELLDRQSLPLLRHVGDRWAVAQALSLRSWAAWIARDLQLAARTANESLELRRAEGDRHGAAESLVRLAAVAREESRVQDALALLQESRSVRQEIGDAPGVAECDHLLRVMSASTAEAVSA